MRRILIALSALSLAAVSNAQLWDGSPLPPELYAGQSSVDGYFSDAPGGGWSEFDSDVGIEFSLQQYGTKPANIDGAHGWVNAANFAVSLDPGDRINVTYLGKTAGWLNDFGMNIGGMNAYGPSLALSTLWSGIDNGDPATGDSFHFLNTLQSSTIVDFWLNSNQTDADPAHNHGGTYSVFYPSTNTHPDNSGIPDYNYSALGKLFNVHDDFNGIDRTILVIALEDWRNYDLDFTDMFFAIEIYDRDGNPQFPVPEPSTYGLIGAMALLGLVAVRRFRRS